MFSVDEAAVTWSPIFMLTATTVPASGLEIVAWSSDCCAIATAADAASTSLW
jgi:hypothetical protein